VGFHVVLLSIIVYAKLHKAASWWLAEAVGHRRPSQTRATKGPGKGTGLGLATCFGIVKESGGNIRVVSEPDQGSTFEVYLPRAEEEAGQLAVTRRSGEGANGMETVLLVEDEPSVRSLVGEVLRGKGYTVLETGDGEEALWAAHERDGAGIDLLLTDVAMPLLSKSSGRPPDRPLRSPRLFR
jgi:hypothetical protein